MTRQRFEVFTPKHGDVVLTTRFRFVARVVTRFIRTLDWAPVGMEATVDGWTWWPTEKALGITLAGCGGGKVAP